MISRSPLFVDEYFVTVELAMAAQCWRLSKSTKLVAVGRDSVLTIILRGDLQLVLNKVFFMASGLKCNLNHLKLKRKNLLFTIEWE